MELKCKPDFADACKRWESFWRRENSRPLILAWSRAPGWERPRDVYFRCCRPEEHDGLVADADAMMMHEEPLLEAMPYVIGDLGPDQFASLLGGPLRFDDASRDTNWMEPPELEWDDFHADAATALHSSTMRIWRELNRKFRSAAAGKYLVGCNDMHSGLDALSALRGPEALCLDLFDAPERVERIMRELRELYAPVTLALEQAAGRTPDTGWIGWIPAWSSERFAVTQCDFSCMISGEDFRRHALPALEQELDFLDRSIYHLDGAGALHHVDDLLGLKKLDAIQWVPGSGRKRMWEWTELLRKFRDAGKLLYIYDLDDTEQARHVHRTLDGYRGCFYQLNGNCSRADAEALADYFDKH